MTFGLSDVGFEVKRLEDILTEDRQRASEIFSDLLEPNDIVDTSDSSTIGRVVNLKATANSTLWEQLQLVYSAFDPNTATGIALDNLVQYSGLTRLSPSYSTVNAVFSGTNGTVVTQGSVVGSNVHNNTFETTGSVALTPTLADGIKIVVTSVANTTDYEITYTLSSSTSNTVSFTSDSDATEAEILTGIKAEIDSVHNSNLTATIEGTVLTIRRVSGTSTFSVTSNLSITHCFKTGRLRAQTIGAISAEANSLNVIKTPLLGWETVTNALPAALGREQETDEELRLRFRNTKFERSSNILDSLYSALINVDGVENVAVYENDTDVTDGNGIPAHSFAAIVLGGTDEEIGDTIWLNKPVGIRSSSVTTNGTPVNINVYDSQEFAHSIGFVRPEGVPIYITMTLDTDVGTFPANGVDLIKTEIINYARENFSVGDDVIYSRLYTPINNIAGHQVNSLFIDDTASPAATSNIAIAYDQIATFSSINIIINTV